jgi:hypothetical protein
MNALLGVVRATAKGIISPTRELGKVATEIASGDGEPLKGTGVEGEGRILANSAIRRLAGL